MTYLEGLCDDEIKTCYTLLPTYVLYAYSRGESVKNMLGEGDDLDLARVLVAV